MKIQSATVSLLVALLLGIAGLCSAGGNGNLQPCECRLLQERLRGQQTSQTMIAYISCLSGLNFHESCSFVDDVAAVLGNQAQATAAVNPRSTGSLYAKSPIARATLSVLETSDTLARRPETKIQLRSMGLRGFEMAISQRLAQRLEVFVTSGMIVPRLECSGSTRQLIAALGDRMEEAKILELNDVLLSTTANSAGKKTQANQMDYEPLLMAFVNNTTDLRAMDSLYEIMSPEQKISLAMVLTLLKPESPIQNWVVERFENLARAVIPPNDDEYAFLITVATNVEPSPKLIECLGSLLTKNPGNWYSRLPQLAAVYGAWLGIDSRNATLDDLDRILRRTLDVTTTKRHNAKQY